MKMVSNLTWSISKKKKQRERLTTAKHPAIIVGYLMKYFYEVLILIIIVMALLAFVFKSHVIAITGITIFVLGCLIEYILNRNSKT